MCNVFKFLQNSATQYPNKVYIVDKGRGFTYSDVYRQSIALAELLNTSALKHGDRVLVYLDNSAEYIAAYFGIILANCVVVPINRNLSSETVSYIISDCTPRYIISNSLSLSRLKSSHVDFGKAGIIDIDKLPKHEAEQTTPLLDRLSTDSSQPALILYTSGTTKMPKGVVLTHNNLTANTDSIIQYLELTDRDSLLAVVSFGYSYGNSTLLTHTRAGGTLFIENRALYPIKVIEQLRASKATGFSTGGSYIKTLLAQECLEPAHLQYLRYLTFAGESVSPESIAKLHSMAPHVRIFVMYGQTEASARLSYLEPELIFKKQGSVGKAIPGVTLRVVTKDGQEASPGELGEIIAAGDNIMTGYWNNEEATKLVVTDGWLHTGDLAIKDDDGCLYIRGRKDDIIKHMGHRISPTEIEETINASGYVFESAVVGMDNTIIAFVVPKNTSVSAEEILDYIRQRLPAVKRPQTIEFVGALPRTANGKIMRSAIKNI